MTSLLCNLLLTCLAALPGARSSDELTYGAALYAYYQQDYDQALLEVMVAQRQGRTGVDPLRFKLAEGSFAFQEGMYRTAETVFDGVAEGELTALDRRRLAFHLARVRYRQGDWDGLEPHLRRIPPAADSRGRRQQHPEVDFMEGELALARGAFDRAEATLSELPEDQPFQAYGLFNLGVARRAAGDADGARRAFSRLAGLPGGTPEAWDVVQRGRLALAVMAPEASDDLDAAAVLGALPAEGRYRNLALASYGNLAMARQEHELAARIWLALLEEPGWTASHAAARLGLPMSLEALASPAHALEGYRKAEQAFEQRLAVLRSVAARVDDPRWLNGLLDAFAVPDEAERAHALGRFDQDLGAGTWFEWLAGEELHRIIGEWRELGEMAGWLRRLPPRLAAYEEVTAERRRRAARAGALLADQALAVRREQIAARVSRLEADLADLAREPARADSGWMLRLANDDERKLIAELEAMAERASARMSGDDRAAFEARLDRLRGLVFYGIAEDKAVRIRELSRTLNDNRALLADIDAGVTRLADAEARFAAGAEADFHLLAERARSVTRQVTAAVASRRSAVAEALRGGLERELARTERYLLTVRVALARATDRLADGAAAAGNSGS